jgi:hypothetical protein
MRLLKDAFRDPRVGLFYCSSILSERSTKTYVDCLDDLTLPNVS